MSRLSVPPLSIYAHMPWCVRKCPYCDFNSHVAPENIPQDRYIERLLSDLDQDRPEVAEREVQSIFFGGGTPSLFSPDAIGRFLEGVKDRIAVASDCEITLEANPGTIERGRFAGYRQVGVNRVSLGVQSFNDHQLKLLGRIHEARHVVEAVGELVVAGFENFNLDLMYGLPNQTVDEALLDLNEALKLRPAHLSHYQLALEPGTVFYHRPPPLPNDDLIWEMQVNCQARLAAEGFEHYEVSAYAREGRRCRHNLNYWRFGDYLGLGAGAHGKWTDAAGARVMRTERVKQPREYLAQENPGQRLTRRSSVPQSELGFEFMLNALRLHDGFTRALFEERTGESLDTIRDALSESIAKGLLSEAGKDLWRPTELGRRFLTDLQGLYLGG